MTHFEKNRIDAEISNSGSSTDPFASAVRATRMPMIITDPHRPDNPIIFVNDAFSKLTGYAREEILGRNCRFLQGPLTDRADIARIREAIECREPIEIELRNYKKNGETFWNRVLISPVFGADGELTHFFASQFDVTLQRAHILELTESARRGEQALDTLVERERRVLADIASGTPLRQVLERLLLAVEAQAGNSMRTSILIMGEDGRHLTHGAAPSLPAAFNEAIDGIPVGEGVGSCGTAMSREAPVYVSDIATDPLWTDFRALAKDHDLAACWSTPIKAADGNLLGTFAIYYREPREPVSGDLDTIAAISQTAALAIERYRSDAALRTSEARLRLAIDAGQIGEWELDLDRNTSVRALRHDQIFGYDRPVKDWGIDTFLAHVVPEDRQAVETSFSRAAESGIWKIQCRIKRSNDGEIRWINSYGAPQSDETGRIVKLFGVVQDITEQKMAEIGLRDLNEALESQAAERTDRLRLYGDIIQSSAAPICAFDTDYRLIAFNRAHSSEFFRIFGHHVQLGEVFPDLFSSDQAPVMRGLMTRALTGESFSVTEEFGDPDLAKPHWEVSYSPLRNAAGTVIGAFHYAKDISEKMKAEAELASTQEALRQSQKMEAVGQLTGGLAHDFNNLLAVITGSLELLERRVIQGRIGEIERFVVSAQSAAKRATALTHRLLAFSRRQTLDPRPMGVNQLIAGMDDLLRRTVGPGITVETVGAAGLWNTLVDPSQLENALLNLCINARDAMPDGGRLTIETANRWLDERAAKQRDLPIGQYVSLCVSDTGTGMPPEVIAKAFDPFFTTKPIGQGTGLGLSMIYGFARQSGGQVRIYSEVGQGTTICVYLPRHYGGTEETDQVPQSAPETAQQGETVLVVDDEPGVRMLVAEVLEELGYAVIEAEDGPSALKVIASKARIDLIVTDVGLPGGMNGRQVADAARVARSGLKVLFITGYAENAAVGNGHLDPGMAVITKPFAVDTLGNKVKDLLMHTSVQKHHA